MKIQRYQEGGQAPVAPAAAPAGGDEQMMQQIAQMAAEIVQQLGPDAAALLAEAIMQLLQGAQQEPVGAAPQEQQFMRCGGKIKKVKKACKGLKTSK